MKMEDNGQLIADLLLFQKSSLDAHNLNWIYLDYSEPYKCFMSILLELRLFI